MMILYVTPFFMVMTSYLSTVYVASKHMDIIVLMFCANGTVLILI